MTTNGPGVRSHLAPTNCTPASTASDIMTKLSAQVCDKIQRLEQLEVPDGGPEFLSLRSELADAAIGHEGMTPAEAILKVLHSDLTPKIWPLVPVEAARLLENCSKDRKASSYGLSACIFAADELSARGVIRAPKKRFFGWEIL